MDFELCHSDSTSDPNRDSEHPTQCQAPTAAQSFSHRTSPPSLESVPDVAETRGLASCQPASD